MTGVAVAEPHRLRKVLTSETTCDETAAAVVTESLQVLGAVVASQDQFHGQLHGGVPEIAARAQVERILPVIGPPAWPTLARRCSA